MDLQKRGCNLFLVAPFRLIGSTAKITIFLVDVNVTSVDQKSRPINPEV